MSREWDADARLRATGDRDREGVDARKTCDPIWGNELPATERGVEITNSWLYRIAENVCTDYFRKTPDDTVPLHLCSERRITSVPPCPSRDMERTELRGQLQVAIAELSPIRRRVFCLYYHHELPIKAIAKQLGRKDGTIKTHLRNAYRQLRELLIHRVNR